MQQKPLEPTKKLWTLYQNCSLPLDRFILCICEADYKQLVITGEAPDDAVFAMWDKIYLEFQDLMNENDHSVTTDLVGKIDKKVSEFDLLNSIINHLKYEFDNDRVQDLNKILKKLGISIPLKIEDREEYFVALGRIRIRANKWIVDIGELKAQLAKKQQKEVTGKTTNPIDYFEDSLDAISKDQGYNIKANELSTAQFCRKVNKLKEKVKKQQLNGSRKNR